jgi:SAM-dependent methyltransferase
MTETAQSRTVHDFGEQWAAHPDNKGFYGSLELFRDMFYPLLDPEEVRGCRVADIGSGTGRIVRMLLEAGAAHVLAVEPSEAFDILRQNLREYGQRVSFLKATGDQLPPGGDLGFIFAYGVLHHIPDPVPVVRAAFAALRPGGRFAAWLYGREGNRLYLALVLPLRAVTVRLPHGALTALVRALDALVAVYIALCKVLQLPMRKYVVKIIGRLSVDKRRLNIYDQLNPAYAKYYTREETLALMRRGGFKDIAIHHRHGYSWTVVATKPAALISRGG